MLLLKKCHGLLGVLRRASMRLPREILKLIYVSLVRSHLEYCSAVFTCSAPTHVNKLDVVQKIASRIITNSSSQIHSAPPQLQLGVECLHLNRHQHVIFLVDNILTGNCHPHFKDNFFMATEDAHNLPTARTKIERMRFSHFDTGGDCSSVHVASLLRARP